MTVETITKLTCNGCLKKVEFIGNIREGPMRRDYPKHWFKIEPNYKQSVWWTSDFSVSGDFCSLECMVKFLQEKIEERDNPKPIYFGGMSVFNEEGI